MHINRLFTQIYVLLIATFLVYFFSTEYLLYHLGKNWLESEHQFLQEAFEVESQGKFYLIEQELSHYPVTEWKARLTRIEENSDYQLQLLTLDSLPSKFSNEAKQRLLIGRIVTLFQEDKMINLDNGSILEEYDRYKRIAHTSFVLEFKINEDEAYKARKDSFYMDFEDTVFIVDLSGFLVMAIVILVWVRLLDKKLQKFHHAAEHFGRGDFTARIPTLGRDEIGQLAKAFNAMMARIENLIQGHKTLTDAVSHELRTPIARLRFALEMLSTAKDEEKQQQYLTRIHTNVDELDKMVKELLMYARLERNTPSLDLSEHDINTLLSTWIANVQMDVQQTIHFFPSSETDHFVTLSPFYMERAVSNLLRNAERYAKQHIQVTVCIEQQYCYIHIDDDGKGVPEADRQRLFHPFVRLDNSRSRTEGGYGLGLAIVKQIAQWHQGDAVITQSPLGGARVSIFWKNSS